MVLLCSPIGRRDKAKWSPRCLKILNYKREKNVAKTKTPHLSTSTRGPESAANTSLASSTAISEILTEFANVEEYQILRNASFDADESNGWASWMVDELKTASAVEVWNNLRIPIRRGAPDALRRMLWLKANDTDQFSKRHPTFYSSIVTQTFGTNVLKSSHRRSPTFCGGLLGPREDIEGKEIDVTEWEVSLDDFDAALDRSMSNSAITISDSVEDLLKCWFSTPSRTPAISPVQKPAGTPIKNVSTTKIGNELSREHNFWLPAPLINPRDSSSIGSASNRNVFKEPNPLESHPFMDSHEWSDFRTYMKLTHRQRLHQRSVMESSRREWAQKLRDNSATTLEWDNASEVSDSKEGMAYASATEPSLPRFDSTVSGLFGRSGRALSPKDAIHFSMTAAPRSATFSKGSTLQEAETTSASKSFGRSLLEKFYKRQQPSFYSEVKPLSTDTAHSMNTVPPSKIGAPGLLHPLFSSEGNPPHVSQNEYDQTQPKNRTWSPSSSEGGISETSSSLSISVWDLNDQLVAIPMVPYKADADTASINHLQPPFENTNEAVALEKKRCASDFNEQMSTSKGSTTPDVEYLEHVTEFYALLNEKGKIAVKSILWCLSTLHAPDFEFCPVIPNLSCILLLFMGENEAFCVLHNVMQHAIKSSRKDRQRPYLTYSRSDFIRFVKLIMGGFLRHFPRLFRHLRRLHVDVVAWISRAVQDGFAKMLPFDYVLRIYGAFLFEGCKVFYRYCLAILKFLKKDLMRCHELTEVEYILYNVASYASLQLTDLTKLAYRIYIRSQSKGLVSISARSPSPYLLSVQLKHLYHPRLIEVSEILTDSQWEILWTWVPSSIRIMDPKLAFRSSRDGMSIIALLRALGTRIHKPMLLIIKTIDTFDIFGGYFPFAFSPQPKYTYDERSSESFLFQLAPTENLYRWTGRNFVCIQYTNKEIFIGTSNVAIYLDSSLLNGRTSPSASFDSPSFVNNKTGDFQVSNIEIWTFE